MESPSPCTFCHEAEENIIPLHQDRESAKKHIVLRGRYAHRNR